MLMKQRLTTIEAERIKFDKSKREQLIDVSTFGKWLVNAGTIELDFEETCFR